MCGNCPEDFVGSNEGIALLIQNLETIIDNGNTDILSVIEDPELQEEAKKAAEKYEEKRGKFLESIMHKEVAAAIMDPEWYSSKSKNSESY